MTCPLRACPERTGGPNRCIATGCIGDRWLAEHPPTDPGRVAELPYPRWFKAFLIVGYLALLVLVGVMIGVTR